MSYRNPIPTARNQNAHGMMGALRDDPGSSCSDTAGLGAPLLFSLQAIQ